MEDNKVQDYIKAVLENIPSDWLQLTTHRLDIYDESQAKTQFIDEFTTLYKKNNAAALALTQLPTAYDYIRLGHPLSCILEWFIAKTNKLAPNNVISFSSQATPILAVLRKNLVDHKKTRILHTDCLPVNFDAKVLNDVYGYQVEVENVPKGATVSSFDGSTIFIQEKVDVCHFELYSNIDFYLNTNNQLGSVLLVHGNENENYISEIQHVRRRETIAMTPTNCFAALSASVGTAELKKDANKEINKASVQKLIQEITGTTATPLIASSGLSIQYAIMMGLVHHANEHHKGKAIKFIVPPNCYGGTNDQARRVAACLDHVEVVDLPVDGDNNMVQSIDTVLAEIAHEDAVPYIIAEIPTNPRVEVPNLEQLKKVLSGARKTSTGETAIDPVFILDQTFCPNVLFLGEGAILSSVRSISYASGSKFPSGGLCTAGYCVANNKASNLIEKIALHVSLCDNEATALQYELLAKQLPSMNQRIADAYKNTRDFVSFIKDTLPTAKINFVSEELAAQGFTPSVFSLDLPTKGENAKEKEDYKRALNHTLINLMISNIPNESKYCVSYGQLKGCYWTIPATSTQGTTKEGDKDYIARVALSANMDLELHKKIFKEFVAGI